MILNKGFSLLEVLVAFSIMAVAMGILLSIFSSGVNTAVVSEEYTVATQIAEGLMAKAGVETPLVLGKTEGIEADKYQWQVLIEESIGLDAYAEPEQQTFTLMEVNVVVKWGETQKRQVELHAVKVGAGS